METAVATVGYALDVDKEFFTAIQSINTGEGVGWNSPYKILYVRGLESRVKNFVNGGSPNLGKPHTLGMEPCMECNWNCQFCSYAARNGRAKELKGSGGNATVNIAPETLLELADFMINARAASCWGGGGEHTMWRDPSGQMSRKESTLWLRDNILNVLGEEGLPMSAVTNMVLADTFAETWMKYHVYLMMNVPSTNPTVFEAVNGTKTLGRVLSNIKFIIDNREKYSVDRKARGLNPRVKLDARVVVNETNAESLVETAEELIGLGVDFVGFRCAGDFEGLGNGISADGVDKLRKYLQSNESRIAQLDPKRTNLCKLLKGESTNGNMTLLIDGACTEGIRCWVQLLGLRGVPVPSGYYPCTQFAGREVNEENDSPWSAGSFSGSLDDIVNSGRHREVCGLHSEQTANGICPEMNMCSQRIFNKVIEEMYKLVLAGYEIPQIQYDSAGFRQSIVKDDGWFI